MSAVIIPLRPQRESKQPACRKLTKAEIAERIYHLRWIARDLDMAITIHGPVKEARA